MEYVNVSKLEIMMKSSLVILLSMFWYRCGCNYVQNGDFELPYLGLAGDKLEVLDNITVPFWHGQFDLMGINFGENMFVGQSIDPAPNYNGYLEQNVTLPVAGSYILAFLEQCYHDDPPNCMLEVWWNGVLVSTNSQQTTNITQVYYIVDGILGSNLLKFVEVGSTSGPRFMRGMYFDEVCVEEALPNNCGTSYVDPNQNITTNETVNETIN